MTNPPTLSNGVVVIDVEASTIGVLVEGNDTESDVVAGRIQLYNEAGEVFEGDGASDHSTTLRRRGRQLLWVLPLCRQWDLSIVTDVDVSAGPEGQAGEACVQPSQPTEVSATVCAITSPSSAMQRVSASRASL